MKVLLQRVARASVTVEGEVVGAIERGLLLFVGVESGDGAEEGHGLVHGRAGGPRHVDEGGIEVLSPGNRSMVAGARRQWIAALGTERRANHDVTDRLPGGHGTRIEVEEFEFAKRKGRQAVSAALVSGELGAVEDVHLTSGPGEKGGRRRAGR